MKEPAENEIAYVNTKKEDLLWCPFSRNRGEAEYDGGAHVFVSFPAKNACLRHWCACYVNDACGLMNAKAFEGAESKHETN